MDLVKEVEVKEADVSQDKTFSTGIKKFFQRKAPAPEEKKPETPAPEEKKPETPAPEEQKEKTPAPEEQKEKTPEEQKEKASLEETVQKSSLDSLLSEIPEEVRDRIRQEFSKKEEILRNLQSASDKSKHEAETLLNEIRELQTKTKTLETKVEESETSDIKVNADAWVSQFNEDIQNDDLKVVANMGKSLFTNIQTLQAKVEAKFKDLISQVEGDIKNLRGGLSATEDFVLENVERRLNPKYDGVVADVPETSLKAYLDSDAEERKKFEQTVESEGLPRAKFQFSEKLQKIMNIQKNPDNWIEKDQVQVQAKTNEEPKPKFDASKITSRTSPVEKPEHGPRTGLSRFMNKRRKGN